jgi:hypothetical protein
MKVVADADGAAKVIEVGAAGHADVLTGVEELAGVGIVEGAGAAAEALARFKKGGAKAAGSEAGGGGESGESGADDEDAISHAKKVSGSPFVTLLEPFLGISRARFDEDYCNSRSYGNAPGIRDIPGVLTETSRICSKSRAPVNWCVVLFATPKNQHTS